MVYIFFDKKSEVSGVNMPLEFNEQLAQELHKPIIRNFKRRTVYSGFRDNSWRADLADIELISSLIKDSDFYCVLLIFLVKMFGLFLQSTKKELVLLMVFKKY